MEECGFWVDWTIVPDQSEKDDFVREPTIGRVMIVEPDWSLAAEVASECLARGLTATICPGPLAKGGDCPARVDQVCALTKNVQAVLFAITDPWQRLVLPGCAGSVPVVASVPAALAHVRAKLFDRVDAMLDYPYEPDTAADVLFELSIMGYQTSTIETG